MPQRLAAGQFYGRTVRRREVGELVLADVRYAPGSRVPRHAHDRAYFCLIRRGSYMEAYGRRTRVCKPGVVAYHPPGEQHAEAMGGCTVASFNVELGPEWLYRMRDGGVLPDQAVELQGGEVAALGRRLFVEMRRSDAASLLAVESLTSEILAALLARPSTLGQAKPRWLTRAREMLDERFCEPLSLRVLAKEAGVHPIHFASAFRRFHGCSAGEYLRRVRFEHLSRMLQQPRMTLAEVAHATGFADQSHFTRFLKRFTGMTPAQYRTFLSFKTAR